MDEEFTAVYSEFEDNDITPSFLVSLVAERLIFKPNSAAAAALNGGAVMALTDADSTLLGLCVD